MCRGKVEHEEKRGGKLICFVLFNEKEKEGERGREREKEKWEDRRWADRIRAGHCASVI